jgi:hypothetical protein
VLIKKSTYEELDSGLTGFRWLKLVFAPQPLTAALVGCGEYRMDADPGCRIQEGTDWHPFACGCEHWKGVWGAGGPSEGFTPKIRHAFQKSNLLV